MIQLDESNHCCGIGIFCEFGFDPDDTWSGTRAGEPSTRTIKEYKDYILVQINKKHFNIYQCSLNEFQHKHFDKMLKEIGFRCISTARNRKSGRKIYLYVYNDKKKR